jgi:3-oxoacyl-[acyl-carrier protein] reductase
MINKKNDTLEFKNKVVLITGSSRGIGSALAVKFGSLGSKVVVNYSHSKIKAMKVASEIKIGGGESFVVKADVSSRKQVEKMVSQVIKKFQKIDILINNAAILKMPSDWQEVTEKDFEKTMQVNIKGVFECTRAVAKQMIKQKQGKIVNISTIGGGSEVIAYISSKNAVNGMTTSFAKGLAPWVNINGVALSLINAGMGKVDDKSQVVGYVKKTPLNRLGKIDDVFGPVLYLASEESRFITGQTLVVDGGRSL